MERRESAAIFGGRGEHVSLSSICESDGGIREKVYVSRPRVRSAVGGGEHSGPAKSRRGGEQRKRNYRAGVRHLRGRAGKSGYGAPEICGKEMKEKEEVKEVDDEAKCDASAEKRS